jgi:hypothetical protein
MKFLNFFLLWGQFWLVWIRIPDPNPLTHLNPDPYPKHWKHLSKKLKKSESLGCSEETRKPVDHSSFRHVESSLRYVLVGSECFWASRIRIHHYLYGYGSFLQQANKYE